MSRRVILYELNEVPWRLVDLYTAARSGSALASLVVSSGCLTTVDDDPVHLQPWRSWPTLHTSLYTDEHRSFDLGQDPSTFRGVPMWDVVDAASRPVGLFGVLQSWPPKRFRAGGFHVPDTFAPSPETEPPELRRFQLFNLAMTRRNAFASDAPISARELALAGLDLSRRGLTARSAATIARQLVRERREPRHTAARSTMQVLPSFDLYWRLHRRYEPHLSVFFTNHVAGMMHRFWADAVPGDARGYGATPDEVYGAFVFDALDLFDRQLATMLRYVETSPDTVLVVASSMGQGPIEHRDMPETYVVEDAERLVRRLGLPGARPLLAMYPRIALGFDDESAAERAIELVAAVRTPSGPLFGDITRWGTTLSFEVDHRFGQRGLAGTVTIDDKASGRGSEVPIDELGVIVRARPGGGNTAFHVPDGILLAYGQGVKPDAARREVSILDVAPSLLELMGLTPDPSMRGHAGLFADAASGASSGVITSAARSTETSAS
jgi:hypothetical protein